MRFVAFVLSALLSFAAWAQAYPNRPVKVVVPYAAGGLPDTMARLVGQKLGESLGQQMVVENRGGAGGIVGTTEVAKAAPDGYTLLVADVTQIAVNPHLFANLPYEPLKELTGVSLLGTSPLYLVAHPSLAANDMKELIALVRSQPGRISYGSSGLGSIHHLAMEALKTGLKLDMVHVPYKGTGQSVPALLGGQVPLLYAALPSIESHVKAGKVKILAISTVQRSPQTPDIPTVAEAGIPGYEFIAEIGYYAPSGTPREIISRLAAEAQKAIKQPDVVQRFRQLGIDPVGSTPEAYNAANRASFEKYAKVVQAAGVKIE
ncbi:MAG TPA: tripartite tricarboxylate transporter substrate binding protein [Burkholderiales bacterium]|jgi:tripartite-type tricarboxylate transporter receptor subunit TctC|nr:tripartite tricarboxylate transporter substrate binding protein [Burkholderiales bacterium]